jgi:Ku protein
MTVGLLFLSYIPSQPCRQFGFSLCHHRIFLCEGRHHSIIHIYRPHLPARAKVCHGRKFHGHHHLERSHRFRLSLVPGPAKAAARSQAVSFNQLHQCDHSRVKQVLYCQAEDKPVSRSELVKGLEYEKDRYVVVEEQELDQITPRSSRVMEVVEFVAAAEVDPVYLDASYYVVPDGAVEKPYTLLYEALRRSGYAALAQWTLHNREHLVLLRPGRFGLLVHTLFYADEVRALDEFRTETEWVAPRSWIWPSGS